ncbi:unnamed protein product, partial [Closterium sp. NIES-54]
MGYEVKDILAMEMRLLQALSFNLIVFHPYRPLTTSVLLPSHPYLLLLAPSSSFLLLLPPSCSASSSTPSTPSIRL